MKVIQNSEISKLLPAELRQPQGAMQNFTEKTVKNVVATRSLE